MGVWDIVTNNYSGVVVFYHTMRMSNLNEYVVLSPKMLGREPDPNLESNEILHPVDDRVSGGLVSLKTSMVSMKGTNRSGLYDKPM